MARNAGGIAIDGRELLSSIRIAVRMPRMLGPRMWLATKLFALAGLACGMNVAVDLDGEDVDDDPADIIRKAGHLQRLEVKPGDRYVITCPGRLNHADADRLREAWSALMDGVPLLVLTEGKSLGVVSQPEQG